MTVTEADRETARLIVETTDGPDLIDKLTDAIAVALAQARAEERERITPEIVCAAEGTDDCCRKPPCPYAEREYGLMAERLRRSLGAGQ